MRINLTDGIMSIELDTDDIENIGVVDYPKFTELAKHGLITTAKKVVHIKTWSVIDTGTPATRKS
jgi:hypothetical protein